MLAAVITFPPPIIYGGGGEVSDKAQLSVWIAIVGTVFLAWLFGWSDVQWTVIVFGGIYILSSIFGKRTEIQNARFAKLYEIIADLNDRVTRLEDGRDPPPKHGRPKY